MAVKSKKPSPAKKSPVAKVEKSKKKKNAASSDVSVAKENEVKPPQDNDEEMETGGVADSDGPVKETKTKVATNALSLKPKMSFVEQHEHSVFVKSIKPNSTEEDLVKFFEPVGEVAKIHYIRCRRSAIVRFAKNESVKKALALDNTSLKGWPIYVERMAASEKKRERALKHQLIVAAKIQERRKRKEEKKQEQTEKASKAEGQPQVKVKKSKANKKE